MALYSRWYESAAHALSNKFVQCEQCGVQYVYRIERVGVGREVSILHLENEQAQKLATEYAEADLAKKIEEGCEPIPCPQCGWYQAAMRERAKELFGLGMWKLGLGFLVFGGFLLLTMWLAENAARKEPGDQVEKLVTPLGIASMVVVLSGLLLLYFRWEWKGKHNPNDAPQVERIEVGRSLALTLDEFKEKGGFPSSGKPPKNYSAYARPKQAKPDEGQAEQI